MATNDNPTKGGWRFARYAVSIAILCSLFYFVDLATLWDNALAKISWQAALWLALVSVALIYVSAIKWQLFLESAGMRVSTLRLFNLYVLGYFVNIIIPSYVGGDALRSWYIGKHVGQHHAFTSTILERLTGIAAMLFLGLCAVWLVQHATFEIKLATVLLALGFVCAIVAALSNTLLSVFGRLPFAKNLLKHLSKIQAGLHVARKQPLLLTKALLLSLMYHSLTVVNVLAAAYAVGWTNVPLLDLFVVVPLVLILSALPVAPSGLGIQEGAFLYFLTALGATPEQALGVGVVLRAKVYIIALFGGVIWLRLRTEMRLMPQAG